MLMSTYQWKLNLMRLPINLPHCPGTPDRLTSWTPWNTFFFFFQHKVASVGLLSALTVFLFFFKFATNQSAEKGEVERVTKGNTVCARCADELLPLPAIYQGDSFAVNYGSPTREQSGAVVNAFTLDPLRQHPRRGGRGADVTPSPTRAAIRGQTVGSRGNYRSGGGGLAGIAHSWCAG